MSIAGFNIRLCQPKDEEAVYEVCLKTGDGGQDATRLYEDPKALGHIFVGPYMRLEPDLAYVLEDSSGVCGYVLGAFDSKKFYDAYLHQWLPRIRKQHPEPSSDPAGWTQTQKVYHEYYHSEIYLPEPYASYPSHLHIDLLPRAQGCGLGRQMVDRLLAELKTKGSPGVHLGMNSTNARAERFYKKLGFHELARVRSQDSEVLYLGKRLR